MKRRTFVKALPTLPVLTAAAIAQDATAQNTTVRTGKAAGKPSSGATGSGKAPDWTKQLRDSDHDGLGPDGKPVPGYRATGTGHARANVDPSKPQQMKLTQEEQNILDGRKGKALAKVMKTVVAFGNAFGATKLVDLGGAPHSSVFNAPPFMKSLIDIFNQCADAPFYLHTRAGPRDG